MFETARCPWIVLEDVKRGGKQSWNRYVLVFLGIDYIPPPAQV